MSAGGVKVHAFMPQETLTHLLAWSSMRKLLHEETTRIVEPASYLINHSPKMRAQNNMPKRFNLMCHSLINTYAATGGRLAGLATFKSLTRLCLSCR